MVVKVFNPFIAIGFGIRRKICSSFRLKKFVNTTQVFPHFFEAKISPSFSSRFFKPIAKNGFKQLSILAIATVLIYNYSYAGPIEETWQRFHKETVTPSKENTSGVLVKNIYCDSFFERMNVTDTRDKQFLYLDQKPIIIAEIQGWISRIDWVLSSDKYTGPIYKIEHKVTEDELFAFQQQSRTIIRRFYLCNKFSTINFDTTNLVDGLYTLALQVYDINGKYVDTAFYKAIVDNTPPKVIDLKIWQGGELLYQKNTLELGMSSENLLYFEVKPILFSAISSDIIVEMVFNESLVANFRALFPHAYISTLIHKIPIDAQLLSTYKEKDTLRFNFNSKQVAGRDELRIYFALIYDFCGNMPMTIALR